MNSINADNLRRFLSAFIRVHWCTHWIRPGKTTRGERIYEKSTSSIESGVSKYHELSKSKGLALVQFDSGGDDERVSAKWSSSIAENWLPPKFKRGHREYSSPFSPDRAAKSVSGSAWTVGRTIAPGFEPRHESDGDCSPRSSRLRLPGWSMASPSSKAEASPRQQSRVDRIRRDLIHPAIDGWLR